MSMRQLAVASMFVMFIGAAGGCAALRRGPDPDPPPNLSTPGFVIDAHIHYRPTDEWEREFIEVFEQWNAIGCVLVRMSDLERGMAFARANPRRVIPYAQIDIDSPTVAEDIQMVYEMGFRGLGELFAVNEWSYEDPKYNVIWEMAERLGLPVLPHTGIHASGVMSKMAPGAFGAIAVRYPDLVIHAAHLGNPWYEEAAEIARRNVNVYFDLTGSTLIKKDRDPQYWGTVLWWTDYLGYPHMPRDAVPAFQKIVFATDEGPSGFEPNILRFNRMLDANGVPDEIRREMYYGTMARIHGINVEEYLPQ